MLNDSLIDPKSIVIVGGSDNLASPGGRVLKNLIDHNFKGELFVVNPKKDEVQGIKSYRDIQHLPNVDLAIIAIPAQFVLQSVKILTEQKQTKGFMIYSAGFSEKDVEGAKLEHEIATQIKNVGGSLLGPNNIGLINLNYTGVFTTPIPKLDPKGVDLVSGSGATAVFIIEAAQSIGLTFSSLYTLGNSAQTGVEEMLEYFDTSFDIKLSSRVKLLYIESIKNPSKFLKHASSLVLKGCKIAAIKAGSSEAGNRAASSHTGALASSNVFIDSLFRKSGIIRCYGRNELISVAGILMQKELHGNNIAIITHAGGPAVMLTDVLAKNGLKIPQIVKEHQEMLLKQLFNGSSATNPIDFLATGTAEQLDFIVDYCENKIDDIDGMVVIFGSPGLTSVSEAYHVLNKKIKSCKKPIYAVLPSVINAEKEIDEFISKNNIAFTDEVLFGNSLVKVFNSIEPDVNNEYNPISNKKEIRNIINTLRDGYMPPSKAKQLLELADINFVEQHEIYSKTDATELVRSISFPVVMKVVGPLHKSDVSGVILNVENRDHFLKNFDDLMQIKGAKSVLVQPMFNGMEIFVGAKKESNFPHIVMCGLGGIYIEAFHDINSCMVPVSKKEVRAMISGLKSYPILKGIRGQKGIDLNEFENIILKISALLQLVPEISELDINPFLASSDKIIAVDARIRLN